MREDTAELLSLPDHFPPDRLTQILRHGTNEMLARIIQANVEK